MKSRFLCFLLNLEEKKEGIISYGLQFQNMVIMHQNVDGMELKAYRLQPQKRASADCFLLGHFKEYQGG